jgi:hypothetical protein
LRGVHEIKTIFILILRYHLSFFTVESKAMVDNFWCGSRVALNCTSNHFILHCHAEMKTLKFHFRISLMKQEKWIIILNIDLSICLLNILSDEAGSTQEAEQSTSAAHQSSMVVSRKITCVIVWVENSTCQMEQPFYMKEWQVTYGYMNVWQISLKMNKVSTW